MNFVKKILLILLTSSLSACSFFYGEEGLIKDTAYDYLDAKQEKDLTIPEPLHQKAKANYTRVPAIGEKAKSAQVGKDLKISAPVQILAVLENVREDKLSDNPAVFVQDNFDFVWQTLIKLFESNEISPAVQDKGKRLIDTGWIAQDERGVWLGIENSDEVDEFRARYQIRLKQEGGSGEVHLEVSRTAAQRLNEDTDQWEDVVSFWQDSAEFLNLVLSNYDEMVIAQHAAARSKVIAGFKVELGVDGQNNAALLTNTVKELVWEKLPKVLEALKFEINDRDRRSMTYFFKYEKEEPGFFASLFDEEQNDLLLEDGDYQAVLSNLGERTAITFKDGQGVPLESEVLAKIYPALSKLFGDRR